MTDVAHLVVSEAEGAEKGERRHDGDDRAHTHRHRNGEQVYAAVGEKDGASDHDPKDGPGCTDRRNVRNSMAPEHGNSLHDDVDDSRPYTCQKVVPQKTISSPHELEFAPEHPEHQHIHENVPDVVYVVEEEIGERLPDTQARHDPRGNKAKPEQETLVGQGAGKVVQESLGEEDCEIRDQQNLDTRSDVKVEADPIALHARPGGHICSVYGGGTSASKRGFLPTVQCESSGRIVFRGGFSLVSSSRNRTGSHQEAQT